MVNDWTYLFIYFPDLLALLNAFAPFSLLGHVNESTKFFHFYLFKSLFSMYSIFSGMNEHTDIHKHTLHIAGMRRKWGGGKSHSEGSCTVYGDWSGIFVHSRSVSDIPRKESCLLLFFSQSSCRVFWFPTYVTRREGRLENKDHHSLPFNHLSR